MVSILRRRHFVPNPVVMHSTGFRAKRRGPLSIHTWYNTGSNPTTANALLTVTNPDGSENFFSYDAEGRLADAHLNGGAEDTTFTYTEGQVTATDALGDATNYDFDDRGLLLQVENPLHSTVNYAYDNDLNLVSTTDAAGQTYTNTYDSNGNLLSSTDPLGDKVSYKYSSTDDRLASVTDAKGNSTQYGYNGKGDLTSTTYANGTVASVAYDPVGNVLSTTNANGQAISYTYDAAGNVLTETFPGGSQNTYTYDSHENLTSATDSTGTTTLTYNADDQLTRITYPSGRYLQFSYNSAGQRMQMVDQTGYAVNYSYNALGKLATLTDGSGNLIAQYTYDVLGRLSQQTNGNGTYTTYSYDAAGDILSVINCAPGGAVNSSFVYTYNTLGLQTSETTVDGQWAYTYNAIGELTQAVFTPNSSDPDGLASQNEQYFYDAAGNRTKTIINGVTTAYTTNDMNQYTQVGNTTYRYDADGNMTAATNPGGTTTYTYNAANQLTGVTSPTGSWSYQYNAFGNRVSSTANGVTTNYVIDPAGLGNIVGEYNAAGDVVAHFAYGTGLVSQTTAADSTYYYAFDAIGSTSDLTNSSGAVVNSYAYDPFGNSLNKTETVANPFQYVGELGVMNEGNGLDFMRARYVTPRIGRFNSPDPMARPATNFYAYASNNPTRYVDPSGYIVQEALNLLAASFIILNSALGPILPSGPGWDNVKEILHNVQDIIEDSNDPEYKQLEDETQELMESDTVEQEIGPAAPEVVEGEVEGFEWGAGGDTLVAGAEAAGGAILAVGAFFTAMFWATPLSDPSPPDNTPASQPPVGSDTYDTTTDFNGDGDVSGETADYYDSVGTVTSTTTDYYNPDLSIASTSTSDYNGDGSVTSATTDYYTGGSVTSTSSTTYSYNADGSSTATTTNSNSSGSVTSQTTTNFNADGSVASTSTTNYGADGSVASKTTDDYATDGSSSETSTDYGSNGNPTSTTSTDYDSDGNVTHDTTTEYNNGSVASTESTNYDTAGNVTSETNTEYNSDGSVAYTESTNYDTAGNIASTTTTDDNSDGSSSTTTTDDNDDGSSSTGTTDTDSNGDDTSDSGDNTDSGGDVTADCLSTRAYNSNDHVASQTDSYSSAASGGELSTVVTNDFTNTYNTNGSLASQVEDQYSGDSTLTYVRTLDYSGGEVTSETVADEIHNITITTQYAGNGQPSVSTTACPDGFTTTTNYGSSGQPTTSLSGFSGGTTITTTFGPDGDPATPLPADPNGSPAPGNDDWTDVGSLSFPLLPNAGSGNLVATAASVTATAGSNFIGQVATFTDADSNPGDYSADIYWGDGTVSSGTISQTSSGHFTIVGSHIYGQTGSYSIGVQIKDTKEDEAIATTPVVVLPGP